MAAMVYAGKIIKDLKLEDDYTLLITGTVQEEDCDGLCWQYIINELKLRPEFVVITEPTSCNIYRGQRGRMEIKITTQGVSCHGSAPERGDNAIYKMAGILQELRALNENLASHPFLGKGTLTVSEIFFTSPSRCAVADSCWVSVDRRLTAGEDKELALGQIRNLPSVKAAAAEVTMYGYERPSYTGLTYPTDCYFPPPGSSRRITRSARRCWRRTRACSTRTRSWTSGPFPRTACPSWACTAFPCIGFGAGHEDQAHAPNERTWKDELVKAAAMYAAIPLLYTKKYADKMPDKTENLA